MIAASGIMMRSSHCGSAGTIAATRRSIAMAAAAMFATTRRILIAPMIASGTTSTMTATTGTGRAEHAARGIIRAVAGGLAA